MRIERLYTEVDGVKEIQLIAFDDSSVMPFVGTIGLLIGRRSSGVRRLFVAASQRRQGIGTLLINECCKIAKGHGSESLGLNLMADNDSAWQFYHKLGFIRAYEYEDGSSTVCKVL